MVPSTGWRGTRPEVLWPAEDLRLGSVGADFKQEYDFYRCVECFGSGKEVQKPVI